MLQQLLRNRLGPSVKISDISFVLPRERLPRKTQQMLDGWCESFAGVGVKNIDTLGYEPPKSSERSRPQEMAELMGLGERFGGAAPRHTVSIPYRAALARRTGRPLAAFTVFASADDQQCHLGAKIAVYPIRRIRESKRRVFPSLPSPCSPLLVPLLAAKILPVQRAGRELANR